MIFLRKKNRQKPRTRLERIRALMRICMEEENWVKLAQAKLLERKLLLQTGRSYQTHSQELITLWKEADLPVLPPRLY